MMCVRHLIGIAVAAAGLVTATGLDSEAKAGDNARALALMHQYLEECGAPKDREYQNYAEAILNHRSATPVPPMSTYCELLYGGIRELDHDLPETPPETYSQAFAKVVFLQDKLMKDCGQGADLTAKGQQDYCSLLYNDYQQADLNFETAKRKSDELTRKMIANPCAFVITPEASAREHCQ